MTKEIQKKTVVVYMDEFGVEPFSIWISSLKNQKTRERIKVRVRRLEQGLYGDCASVGAGVSELRLFFGPGFRVYFAEDLVNTVVLLAGGDKGSQKQDIKIAKEYWKEYKENA